MAQKQATQTAGRKRGPGRPPRNAEPASKKTRTASPADSLPPPATLSPALASPPPEKRVPELPVKVVDNRPLPSLPQAQPPLLSDSDYKGIPASAVLETSLDRSRNKWVAEGVLQRYWVKPETGKHARPPPPNNPEVKWQKHQGPCRIRIEPHILEVDLYVEQKPKPLQQVKHYTPPGSSFRPGQPFATQHNSPFNTQRMLSPMQPPLHHGNAPEMRPMNGPQPSPMAAQLPAARSAPPPPAPQEKKPPTDPVISMLASRASSDPVLKALMKEVANGNATQEQLKVFQAHIDELTKIINDKKKKEDEEQAARNAAQARQPPSQNNAIKYEAPPDNRAIAQPKNFQPPQTPASQAFRPLPAPYQPPAPLPPPAPQPVILAFTSPGASEDRFLFPQNSILESLSPQHLLASFVHTQHGRQAADPTGLDPDTEYWQPITLMVEVAYKREHFLDFIKRWVKPADEVRKHMEDAIKRCTRAPVHSLALRLPFRGSTAAESDEAPPEIALPLPPPPLEESKPRKSVKYVKKNAAAVVGVTAATAASPKTAVDATKGTAGTVNGSGENAGKVGDGPPGEKAPIAGTAPASAVPASEARAPTAASAKAPATEALAEKAKDDGKVLSEKAEEGEKASAEKPDEPKSDAANASAEGQESARPKRAVRKSARISDAA